MKPVYGILFRIINISAQGKRIADLRFGFAAALFLTLFCRARRAPQKRTRKLDPKPGLLGFFGFPAFALAFRIFFAEHLLYRYDHDDQIAESEDRSMPEFECRLKKYRQLKELTQEQLAEKVGVRRETIMRLEKAQYNPSLKLAIDISRAVEAPIEEIFIFE